MQKILALGGLAFASADEFVKTLTKANFKSTLDEYPDGLLVEYYAPWCGHCKQLAPEYEKAAEKLSQNPKLSKYALGKVDATEESELGSEAGVQGYPTLKWYVGGKPQDYEGGRTADTIVEWIEMMTGPSVIEEAPPADAKYHLLYEGAEIPEWFSKYASANRKKKFYFVKGSTEKVSVVHPGEDPVVGEGIVDTETFEKFIDSNQLPVFGAITGESFQTYAGSKQGLVWLLPKVESAEVAEAAAEALRPLATELKPLFPGYNLASTDTIQFADPIKSMFDLEEFPAAIFQPTAAEKPQYIYAGELTKDALLDFYNKIQSGEIQPKLKSEEVPEDQDEPVKVVVGKNFAEMVFQESKDVLLEVYAPWCGHCKKLEPEYKKVAKKIEKEGLADYVVLAKLDGTANDSPDPNFKWSGFPTMFWIKAGEKTPADYEGPRDAKGLWKWLKKNMSKADEIEDLLKKNKEAKAADTPKEEL